MKKKIIIISFVCIFLLFSGICYSCAYNRKTSSVLVASVTNEKGTEVINDQTKDNQSEVISTAIDSSSVVISSEVQNSTQDSPNTETIKNNQALSQNNYVIYVHICGSVVNPGVYQAKSGARLYEFLDLAGGLTEDAAGDYINQAQLLTDGQRIYIPSQKELDDLSIEDVLTGSPIGFEINNSSIATMDTTENQKDQSALININTAGKEELMSISGIGQAKANSIIAYREKNGKFQVIEDLMKIPGIKEGLFDQISYMIVAK